MIFIEKEVEKKIFDRYTESNIYSSIGFNAWDYVIIDMSFILSMQIKWCKIEFLLKEITEKGEK